MHHSSICSEAGHFLLKSFAWSVFITYNINFETWQKGGPFGTEPFWSPAPSQANEMNWLVHGEGTNWTITKLEETKWPVTRIDEIICFNKTKGGG